MHMQTKGPLCLRQGSTYEFYLRKDFRLVNIDSPCECGLAVQVAISYLNLTLVFAGLLC